MKIVISVFIILLSFGSVLSAQERAGADTLYNDGKYQEAINICLEELKVAPKNINAYCYLIWSLQRLKNFQDAYKYAVEGMQVDRYDRRMIFAAGESLFNMGRNRDALKYFEEYMVYVVVPIHKDEVSYYMGEIFIRLGEANNADIAFSTAVHYNSKNAYWWARLGYAREMTKDYEWALDAYDKALLLNPTLAEAKIGKERVAKLTTQ